MGQMIDFSQIAADARKNSDILTMPEFNLGMGAYRRPVTASAVSYAEPTAPDNLGGAGGDRRSYVPQQDAYNMSLVPPTTYDPNAAPEPTPAPAPAPEQPAQNSGLEEKEQQIEQVAQNGTIEQLLAALRDMASMQPGEHGNPVFQLDAMYKGSSALGGLPGTVAQYPTAGGMTRETDFSL
jgi:hypothetical protein